MKLSIILNFEMFVLDLSLRLIGLAFFLCSSYMLNLCKSFLKLIVYDVSCFRFDVKVLTKFYIKAKKKNYLKFYMLIKV